MLSALNTNQMSNYTGDLLHSFSVGTLTAGWVVVAYSAAGLLPALFAGYQLGDSSLPLSSVGGILGGGILTLAGQVGERQMRPINAHKNSIVKPLFEDKREKYLGIAITLNIVASLVIFLTYPLYENNVGEPAKLFVAITAVVAINAIGLLSGLATHIQKYQPDCICIKCLAKDAFTSRKM